MKKSQNVVLSAIMFATISSCSDTKSPDEWTTGRDQSGKTRDTAVYRNGAYHHYRYFGTGWFLLHTNNMINTGRYTPSSSSEISNSSFTPRFRSGGVHTGGFGHSAHSSGS